MNLREEKGYTYGIGAGFDMRRGRRAVRGSDRGADGGHGSRHLRVAGRAAPHSRDARSPPPSWTPPGTTSWASFRCGSRRRGRSSGRWVASSSTSSRTTSWPVTGARSRRSRSRRSRRRLRITSIRTGWRSSPWAMPMPSAAELESAGFGELEVIAEEIPTGRGRPTRPRWRRFGGGGRVIVVVGLPAYADSPDGERCAGGLAVEVAAAAERRGGEVELVGKVGNDGAGDAVVVALGRLGIGHAALLRDPVRPTPVLAAPAGDDEAAEVDGGGPEARLLPEDPAAGHPSRPRTWNWHCASCPRQEWSSSPTRSASRRDGGRSRGSGLRRRSADRAGAGRGDAAGGSGRCDRTRGAQRRRRLVRPARGHLRRRARRRRRTGIGLR